MNRSSNRQLDFHFRITDGLPVPVSPRSIRVRARRRLAQSPMSLKFNSLEGAERIALAEQLREKYRRELRGKNAAEYAGTPEGRRMHRALDLLALEIVEAETLCG